MIFTLTPNPALDLGGVVAALVPNEKSYVHEETRFPGGNGINAARMIHKIGLKVVAGGFLGGGTGREVAALLKKEGIRTQFIPIAGSTRISVTVSSQKSHLQTRLSFPGPPVTQQELEKLSDWLDRIRPPAILVVGGSLPLGFSAATLKKILQRLQQKGVHLILDTPPRPLRTLLSCRPLLIKPNLVEFRELTGQSVNSVRGVLKAARALQRWAQWVCVSSVEGGALLLHQDQAWFGQIPSLSVRTTVGAGDSMVGAMSAVFSKYPPPIRDSANLGESLLRWGLAAAAATLVTPGTRLGEFKKMRFFYPKIHVRALDGKRSI